MGVGVCKADSSQKVGIFYSQLANFCSQVCILDHYGLLRGVKGGKRKSRGGGGGGGGGDERGAGGGKRREKEGKVGRVRRVSCPDPRKTLQRNPRACRSVEALYLLVYM